MSLKDLEKVLQEKFNEEHHDIDRDALWIKVQPEIKKDKRKPLFLWLTLGLGLLVLSSWYLIGFMDTSNELTESTITKAGPEVVEDVLITEDASAFAKAEIAQVDIEKDVTTQVNVATAKNGSTSIGERSIRRTISQESFPIFNSNVVMENLNSVSAFEKHPLNSSFLNMSKVIEKKETLKSISFIGFLTARPIGLLNTQSFVRDLKVLQVSELENKTHNSNAFKRFVDHSLLVGFGWIDKKLSASNASSSSYLAIRNASEQPLESWTAEWNMNLHVSENWKLRTGIDYRMITERTVTMDSVSAINYSNLGFAESLETTTTTKTAYNYYNQIGIPLQMVYQTVSDKVGFEAGIGVRINPILFANGKIQSESGNEYDLNTDDSNLFGQRFNTDLIIDAGLIIPVSQRVSWNLRAQYDYALNGINSTSNSIDQKYNLIKIKTGLTFQF